MIEQISIGARKVSSRDVVHDSLKITQCAILDEIDSKRNSVALKIT